MVLDIWRVNKKLGKVQVKFGSVQGSQMERTKDSGMGRELAPWEWWEGLGKKGPG